MGVASLVLGIVSLVLGFIPFCGIIALAPAIVGLILGIIDWVKKSKAEGAKKGQSIAGTICSALAIIIILFYYITVIAAGNALIEATGDLSRELEQIESSYDYNY